MGGCNLDDAVRVLFTLPQLVAADQAGLTRSMVLLRDAHRGEDLANLIISDPHILQEFHPPVSSAGQP